MPTATFRPGPQPRTVLAENGQILQVPEGWELLPPGDPGLTRRVKAAGEHWVVQEKRGRKIFSRGVYAPGSTIERIRQDLAGERATETYAKKQVNARKRREKIQVEYVADFRLAVLQFLNFHPAYADLADKLSAAVTALATPVGSNTVARTQRIPLEQRAEAALIAWLRHQTTSYDSMSIPRIAGKRREVRRQLAERSRNLLDAYRLGQPASPDCPLQAALSALPT